VFEKDPFIAGLTNPKKIFSNMQSDPKRRFCKRQFINGKPVISVGIDFAQVT
jgi:hypothetical protein